MLIYIVFKKIKKKISKNGKNRKKSSKNRFQSFKKWLFIKSLKSVTCTTNLSKIHNSYLLKL